MMSLAESLKQEGYVIVSDVLSSEEINSLKILIDEYLEDTHNTIDYSSYGEGIRRNQMMQTRFQWVYTHDKVIENIREALEYEDIIYTFEAVAHKNRLSGWHKDSDGLIISDPNHPKHGIDVFQNLYSDHEFQVVNCAFYLEDHQKDDHGLTIRRGSHYSESMTEGEIHTLHFKAGDLIIFDTRLTHHGQVMDMVPKILWRLASIAGKLTHQDPDYLSSYLNKYYMQLRRWTRYFFCFAYGSPNEFTSYFAEGHMEKQWDKKGALKFVIPEDLRQRFEEKGLKYWDPDLGILPKD